MRKRFIAGNWKMNNGPAATAEFMDKFTAEIKASKDIMANIAEGKMEVAIFAPAISLPTAVAKKNGAPVIVGGENVHWEKSGAFTGEISVPMLTEVGCTHVIIGHSERRHIFRETNEELNKKMVAALEGGLIPVLCVGELLNEREEGKAFDVIKTQLDEGLKGIDSTTLAENVIIAYEPVWAIGTGKTASNADAQEVCKFIRDTLAASIGVKDAEKVIILYGGSVKAANTAGLLAQNDIDGTLVGGASLKPDSFLAIAQAAVR